MTLYGDCTHLFSTRAPCRSPLVRKTENSGYADVILWDDTLLKDDCAMHCALFLFNAQNTPRLPQNIRAQCALSCGMCAHDTLSFSSVKGEHAFLCLTRSFFFQGRLYEPMEQKVSYDPSLSLYRNLTRAFVTDLLPLNTNV